jgi:hypothetical protein
MMKSLLLGIVFASSAMANPLEGYWESVEHSNGGIGSALVLQLDGTYKQITTVMVDSTYTYRDGKLVMVDPDDFGTSTIISVRIDGNILHQTSNEEEVTMERFGSLQAGTPSIIGVWMFKHDAGGIAYMRYSSDGRCQLRLPLHEFYGVWSVSHKTISFDRDSKKSKAQYEVTEDRLLLNFGGQQTHYLREPAGRWYGKSDVAYKRK